MDKASVLKVLSISDTYDVTVDDAKLQAYVEELAANFNTYGKVRTFRTQVMIFKLVVVTTVIF